LSEKLLDTIARLNSKEKEEKTALILSGLALTQIYESD